MASKRPVMACSPAVLGGQHSRPGSSQESRAAYDRAIELAGNTAETAYLTRRRDQLE